MTGKVVRVTTLAGMVGRKGDAMKNCHWVEGWVYTWAGGWGAESSQGAGKLGQVPWDN